MFYGVFVWFDGFASVLVDFRLLVLLSLSTRGMFPYLCMLGMLYVDVCIIDLGFQKILNEKLQMAITFDKELGFRCSKNESCSKWGNEALGQLPKAVGPTKISKLHRLVFLFYFFVIFHPFFYIVIFDFTYLYLL